jgi:hypothetical protein
MPNYLLLNPINKTFVKLAAPVIPPKSIRKNSVKFAWMTGNMLKGPDKSGSVLIP